MGLDRWEESSTGRAHLPRGAKGLENWGGAALGTACVRPSASLPPRALVPRQALPDASCQPRGGTAPRASCEAGGPRCCRGPYRTDSDSVWTLLSGSGACTSRVTRARTRVRRGHVSPPAFTRVTCGSPITVYSKDGIPSAPVDPRRQDRAEPRTRENRSLPPFQKVPDPSGGSSEKGSSARGPPDPSMASLCPGSLLRTGKGGTSRL